MNNYALTIVFKPDTEEKARKEFLDSVKKRVVKVEKEENWGIRDLAYSIKHHTKGYYVHMLFNAEPSSIQELDKSLKLEEDIIRHLLIRV